MRIRSESNRLPQQRFTNKITSGNFTRKGSLASIVAAFEDGHHPMMGVILDFGEMIFSRREKNVLALSGLSTVLPCCLSFPELGQVLGQPEVAEVQV